MEIVSVTCLNSHHRNFLHNKPRTSRKFDHLFLLGLIISLIVIAPACGKKKTEIKAPNLPATTAASSTKTETVRQGSQPPAAKAKPPEAVVAVSPPSSIAPADSPTEFAPGPLIRIGLDTASKEIRISSAGDYYLTKKISEAKPELISGDIQIRVERENDEKSDVYRVQIASYSNTDLAADLQKKISDKYDQPAIVFDDSASGLKKVRVGEYADKEKAAALLKKVVKAGYHDAFIVKETHSSGSGETTIAVRGQKLFHLSRAGFLFQPVSHNNFLKYNGKPYRGLFDISLNKNGNLTIVNQLGTEEYLLGVVPAELNPSKYPEFAALAAQSIAARTYALKNIGRFRSEGFDLSDDTRTQVYAGVSGENKISDAVVRQTSGLAIYYQDKLIDAMFMSTCGGRTEDFSNVFDGPPVPYLKSVFCTIENGRENGETIVEGKHELDQVFMADDGTVANRNIELARILGIISSESPITPESLAKPIDKNDAAKWIENAVKIARIKHTGSMPELKDAITRAGFLSYSAELFFGAGELKNKVSEQDVNYYLGNIKDGDAVSGSARHAFTYLMQNGMWRPFPDNTIRPDEPILRGDALSIMLRWTISTYPELLRRGIFIAPDVPAENSIRIKWGTQTKDFQLAQKPSLFRRDAERTTPVNQIKIIGNEKLFFHLDSHEKIDFLEMELSPTGASSDRYSPSASWDATLTRAALAEKLKDIAGPIGEIMDLKPSRTGNSGRAVQIQIIGSRNSTVINGYKVRNALGLKDTLFIITREYNPDGSIAGFTFHGHGWGHGVGLCQVGAYGMARAGRSYEEILKTYYQGVQIRKAY
jgi:stage II sporulation protein D